MSRREYHVDLTTGGTTYVPGKDGAIKTYLNAVPYDHILTMTLPYIGRYTMGCNDEDNPETVARNTVVRLGISASSNVGARLITEIKEKILSVLPLLGSSSAQPSKSLTSADLPNTFNTKFDNPFTEVLYPKLLISHQLSSSTDREQDENPLSNRKKKHNSTHTHLTTKSHHTTFSTHFFSPFSSSHQTSVQLRD